MTSTTSTNAKDCQFAGYAPRRINHNVSGWTAEHGYRDGMTTRLWVNSRGRFKTEIIDPGKPASIGNPDETR